MPRFAPLPLRLFTPRALPLLCLLLLTGSGPAMTGRILVISTSPAQSGKFLKMRDVPRKLAAALVARFAEKLPADACPALLQGYDLVLFDTPRDHLQACAYPIFGLRESMPRWHALPDGLTKHRYTYYVNRGRLNISGFSTNLSARRATSAENGPLRPPGRCHCPQPAIHRREQSTFIDDLIRRPVPWPCPSTAR
ncbi:hypothetical protein [Zoogloea sp.]|uniref:hypothetical protein n=1 Tax=Zoogloea sp. TaxID=49181 RepID=UPI002C20C585|nr:hypothetical protein [Zoogloea sp.]